jgi:hypothetical protein
MPKHYKCAVCGKYRLKHRRPIRTQSLKEYVEKTIGHSTNEDDVICSKCRSVFTDIFQIVVTMQLIRILRNSVASLKPRSTIATSSLWIQFLIPSSFLPSICLVIQASLFFFRLLYMTLGHSIYTYPSYLSSEKEEHFQDHWLFEYWE